MKNNYSILPAIVVLAVFLSPCRASIDLGSAGSFAVLGGTTVTSTGDTVLNGNLGVAPGTAFTGFGPGIVNGTTHGGDAVAQQASTDAYTAYTALNSQASIQDLTGMNLGGLTLLSGVRDFNSSAQLTGTLVLDAQGNSAAQFIFLIGSTLTTASGSAIVLINGAQAGNIIFVVGSSATLGTDTSFYGNILADQSITLNTGASVTGSVLALNGALTLDDNTITVPNVLAVVPEPTTLWSRAICAFIFGRQWWIKSRQKNKTLAQF